MYRQNCLYCLYFHNDQIFNNKIQFVTAIQGDILVFQG